MPTEIKWSLPPDWKAGEIQWPIPLRLKDPGNIETYGYENEVLLLQEITPPASLSGSSVKLSAEADWLVCERLCIPGSAKLEIELPVADKNAPANEEIFARYRRALPQDWPGDDVAKASWTRSGSELQLAVESSVLANYPVAEFFPLPGENLVVGHPQTERGRPAKLLFAFRLRRRMQNCRRSTALSSSVRTPPERTETRGRLTAKLRPHTLSAPSSASDLLKFLLFGFIGGFILNLMPCVLPVISLKIFGFIQHAGQSRGRILRSGLAFIAGIFAWFIGLALLLIVLKSLGREITWAFQFTNPWFVLVMSAVVLVFALNLFGVFEISLPQSANRGVLGWTAREGDAGSFFQGVFATVLATPCTAPFLGTALGFAFTQSGWTILAMFVAIAAGMSFPYLLLSAQPAWLRLLPKPGPWMERVKQLMGFFLLATLLFLLWVIGAERGVEGIIWTACLLLALSLACWMKGSFLVPTASRATRFVVLVLVLLLVLGSGWYFGVEIPSHHAPFRRDANRRRRLATLHPRASPERDRSGPHRLRRFHRRLVPDLQVQRSDRARERGRPRSLPASRYRQDQGRLDQCRSRDHKNFETIWPARCPIVCAVPGGQASHCLSGIAHAKHDPGKTGNHHTSRCC